MGQTNEKQQKNKGTRGSADNAGRLRALLGASAASAHKVNWDGCDPLLIGKVVALVVGMDGMASFGRSRDGGSCSLSLYLDGDRQTLWFNGDAVLDDELEKVVALLSTLE